MSDTVSSGQTGPRAGRRRVLRGIVKAVVIAVIGLFGLWFTELPVRLFPASSVAAVLSGYSPKITTVKLEHNAFNLGDGTFLATRHLIQSRSQEGVRAFPDGGRPFRLLEKWDVVRVGEEGEVLWQNEYVVQQAFNYEGGALQVAGTSTFPASQYPDVLRISPDPLLSLVTIRRCSSDEIQVAATNTPRPPGQTVGTAGVATIHVASGSTIVSETATTLCEEDVTQAAAVMATCERLDVKSVERHNYSKYVAYCVPELFHEISLPGITD